MLSQTFKEERDRDIVLDELEYSMIPRDFSYYRHFKVEEVSVLLVG